MSALSLSRSLGHRLPGSWQARWAAWASWEDDLDVSGGRQRAAWWSWLLLAAGALAVMMAVDQLDALRMQQEDTAEQVKRLSRADRQMRLQRALAMAPPVPPHTSPRAASAPGQPGAPGTDQTLAPALQGPALPAARRMVGLLAYPWPTHLDSLDAQATEAQVVMTQVAVSLDAAMTPGAQPSLAAAGGVRWQLKAYAKDDASALAWAHRLPQGELTSREVAAQPFTTRAGTYALKVSLEMQP